jgi:hypothetical protein
MVFRRLSSVATVLSTFSSLTRPSMIQSKLISNNINRRTLVTMAKNSLYSSKSDIFIIRGGASNENVSSAAGSNSSQRNLSTDSKFIKLSDPAPGSRKFITSLFLLLLLLVLSCTWYVYFSYMYSHSQELIIIDASFLMSHELI